MSALVAAGYRVYAINPRSVDRYRERHHVGGGKSDAGDAKLLADLVRTDRHNHRGVAGDLSDSLHNAACHACLFAPETSCEVGNRHLNRATAVPILGQA